MNKFIDPIIYNYICTADKESLFKMKRELTKELDSGIISGANYLKELQLIETRLKGVIG